MVVLRLPFLGEILDFVNVGFWGEGKTEVPVEKNSWRKGENQQQLNPHRRRRRDLNPGHIGGRRVSAITTAPSLAPRRPTEYDMLRAWPRLQSRG